MSHVARLVVRNYAEWVHGKAPCDRCQIHCMIQKMDDKGLAPFKYSSRELRTPDCVSGAEIVIFATIEYIWGKPSKSVEPQHRANEPATRLGSSSTPKGRYSGQAGPRKSSITT